MTAQDDATPAATWVAIDIAKRAHAVLIAGALSASRRILTI